MPLQSLSRNSFIRVYSGGSIALPVIPMRETGRISPPIIFVPGEQFAFYVCYGVGGGLTMTNGSGQSYSAGGASSFAVPNGNHSKIEGSVPGMPDGCYKLSVGGMESNYVEVINDVSLANQISAYFSVKHNKALGPFSYPRAGESFRQKMRLRVSLTELQQETNMDVYEETNTGKIRNLQGVVKEYVSFQTPDYELEDHQAMAMLTLHDSIIINGRNYTRRPSGAYKGNFSMDTPLSNGDFSLYDNDATFLLRC